MKKRLAFLSVVIVLLMTTVSKARPMVPFNKVWVSLHHLEIEGDKSRVEAKAGRGPGIAYLNERLGSSYVIKGKMKVKGSDGGFMIGYNMSSMTFVYLKSTRKRWVYGSTSLKTLGDEKEIKMESPRSKKWIDFSIKVNGNILVFTAGSFKKTIVMDITGNVFGIYAEKHTKVSLKNLSFEVKE